MYWQKRFSDSNPEEEIKILIKEIFEELQRAIDDYIYYYNHKRINAKLAGLNPIEYLKQSSPLSV